MENHDNDFKSCNQLHNFYAECKVDFDSKRQFRCLHRIDNNTKSAEFCRCTRRKKAVLVFYANINENMVGWWAISFAPFRKHIYQNRRKCKVRNTAATARACGRHMKPNINLMTLLRHFIEIHTHIHIIDVRTYCRY